MICKICGYQEEEHLSKEEMAKKMIRNKEGNNGKKKIKAIAA